MQNLEDMVCGGDVFRGDDVHVGPFGSIRYAGGSDNVDQVHSNGQTYENDPKYRK